VWLGELEWLRGLVVLAGAGPGSGMGAGAGGGHGDGARRRVVVRGVAPGRGGP
jgi:hypothetical protein